MANPLDPPHFETLDGCQVTKRMRVNSRKLPVRLSSVVVIDRYDWKLFQDGELVEQAHRVTTGISDGTCIQFTPSKPLRRGDVEDLRVPQGFFFPPFGTKRAYKTLTYHGHSDFSVDFNRGDGGNDEGEWVLAPAPGKVAVFNFRFPGTNGPDDKGESDLVIDHPGGFRTVYTHMKDHPAKVKVVGNRVRLRQRLGRISAIGNATGPHLHHCHFRNVPFPDNWGEPIKMRIRGVEQEASVHNSNTGVPEGFRLEPRKRVRAPVLRAIFKVRVWRGEERSGWRELRFLVTKEDEPVPECVDPGCPPAP
jgi:hypothetical protein